MSDRAAVGSCWSATVPAKLNLGLSVNGRRDDGFHDLWSVMQTVTICDGMCLRHVPQAHPATVDLVSLNGADGALIEETGLTGTNNLAVTALVGTLQRSEQSGDFRLSLTKRIPAASGMGGASADAAAAILLAERSTSHDLGPAGRLSVAESLGSDVPFFLTGGTALVSGRGERVGPLPR